MHKEVGTKLSFSSTYHPKSNGHTKIITQILKDMLRMYSMDHPTRWEDYLHLLEFAYQESLKIASFKSLYSHICSVTT